MKKTILLIGLLSLIGMPNTFAGDPPASVTIKAIQDKQSAVTFPHKAHMDKVKGKCVDCHTTPAGGSLKPAFTNAQGKGQMGNAYHAQCLECHKKTKGPTACSNCHKK